MNENKKLSELLPITEATTDALRKLGEDYNFVITCQDFMPDGSLSEKLTTKNVSVSELEVAAELASRNDLRLLIAGREDEVQFKQTIRWNQSDPSEGGVLPLQYYVPVQYSNISLQKKDPPVQPASDGNEEDGYVNYEIPDIFLDKSPVQFVQQPSLDMRPATVPLSFPHRGDSITVPSHKENDKINSYQAMLDFIRDTHVVRRHDTFFFYNSTYYAPVTCDELPEQVLESCRHIVERKGSPEFVFQVVKFLKIESRIKICDTIQTYVAFQNCLLEAKSGRVMPHTPEHLTFYRVEANYLDRGDIPPTPAFDQFLMTVSGGDPLLVRRIYEMIGYILSPDLAGKVFFLLQGVPNSGKSVLSSFLYSLLSPDSTVTLDAHDFGAQFSMAGLDNMTFCLSSDMPSTPLDAQSVSRLKQFTGGDIISTDVKFGARKSYRPTAKLLMATNHPLVTKDMDPAFFDRIVTIPFRHSVPREMWDTDLFAKLLAERDPIVTRAMIAYRELVARKYRFSGDYPPNQITSDSSGPNDLRSAVYAFVRSCLCPAADGIVYTDEAHQVFSTRYINVSLNEFASLYYEAVEVLFGMYGLNRKRNRKENKKNAQASIEGLRFIGLEGIMS